MKHKRTVLNLILILLLCLSFITPFTMPQPVLAAEEEEEDNFTTMPNYRWENQSTTDSAVQEELIGTQYFINNTNAGAGTQKFAKSRQLNSRDFYFESRFALDVGGSADEYWTDEENNVSDFNDNTTEMWNAYDPEDTNLSIEDGWLVIESAGGSAGINTSNSVSIDADTYKWFTFEIISNVTIADIIIYDSDLNYIVIDTIDKDADTYYLLDYDLDLDADWTGTETDILLGFDSFGLVPYKIKLNMTYLYDIEEGYYSTTDGFKFSLLNADDEEGMAFQFTRDNDLSYNISIDMYDAGGIALDYDYSFNYSIDVDGWLRLRTDWHLDKKNVKILLEYENGTDIINIRRITDLYGGNLGFPILLLLEEGFPSLCLNNSVGAVARSLIYIDYIDADWEIVEWREPASPVYTEYWGSKSNYVDEHFTSVSPYGLNIYHKSRGDTYKFYQLCVDRFDGLSFDISIETSGLDAGTYDDWAGFVLSIYNVQTDGTALFVGEIATCQRGGTPGTVFAVYNRTGDVVLLAQALSTREDIELDVSFWHEDREKSILQFHYLTETFDVRKQISFGHEFTENFTKEYVFIFGYGYRTSWSDAANDEIDTLMGAFELIRKDLIGDLVALVFSPIVDMLAIIFSPLILLFQILTIALVKAFKQLSVALEPFFDILGTIFTTAISSLGGIFGTIIDGLELVLKLAIEAIWTNLENALVDIIGWLLALADIIAEFIIAVVEWIFPIISEVIEVLWGFIMAFLTWVWEDFIISTPLGFIIVLVVEAINSAPVILMGIINLFLFWQFWILIGIWIVVLPMQAAQCEGVSDFLERILGIFCIDALPIDLLGFGFWFPLAIPLLFWTGANIIVLA